MNTTRPTSSPKRIGILTGGGIAPGLNPVMFGAIRQLQDHGDVAVGIEGGWAGMLAARNVVDFRDWTHDRVEALMYSGGTALGSSRTKIKPAEYAKVRATAAEYGIDGLITIGGDDTLGQAARLSREGIVKAIGVPKTIDNDVDGTERTFGFETAVHEANLAIRRMRVDARSMGRVAAVEIMGRDAGWITLDAGHTAGADITLIPEFPIDEAALMDRVREIYERQGHVVIAVAEGYEQPELPTPVLVGAVNLQAAAAGVGGTNGTGGNGAVVDAFGHKRKEDAGKRLLGRIAKATGYGTQLQITGYSVRNGDPLAQDALFSSQLGAAAGHLAHLGEYGKMVALRGGRIVSAPLEDATGGRHVTEEHYDVKTMRRHLLPPNWVQTTAPDEFED
jgi:6-phosphofructokinase 1